MAILVEHVHLQLAEAPAEGDLLRFIDVLLREHEQKVAMKRRAYFSE